MGSLFRVLLLVGFLVKFWWLILAALVVVVAACLGWWCCMQIDAADAWDRRERAALIERADQQHAWVLAGDDRGVYGEFHPEVYPSGYQSKTPATGLSRSWGTAELERGSTR